MPKVSNRGNNMAESPIRKLSGLASNVKRSGREIIHLNIGQPDIDPPQEVLDYINNINVTAIPYGPSDGIMPLKESMKKYYAQQNITLDAADILICSGASEAILFVMNAITDFGDEILTFEPFYANYIGFALFEGVNIRTIKASIHNHFALPDLKKIEDNISPKTKAILLCNPNNPTGYVYSYEELKSLVEIALKYDLYLIVDEVYREFLYDENTKAHSVLNFPELAEHAIMLDSVSKRFSMCGARIGCIVSRNKTIMQTILKYAQARLCPPTIEQELAMIAFEKTTGSYYQKVVEKYKSRRDYIIQRLTQIPDVICAKPMGAFYVMVQLPVADTDHFAKWLLESFELHNTTLMLAPGSGFYNNPTCGKQQVRIAYVLKIKELEKAMNILEAALKVYLKEITKR